ncbi:ferredoxin [Caenispirillum salinarum]|uniref:ferredoxin n=1 Tax=Caenispirillum salinarum TaxID=859058 RepID=UPI00384FCC47
MMPDTDHAATQPSPRLRALAERLADHGLLLRGAFHPDPDDGLAADVRTVVLVGNAGPAMWEHFSTARAAADAPHELDGWTRRVLAPLADDLGAGVAYPFGGPPFQPFQRWAMKAEGLRPSPVGVLLHPDYGPWHAYRGAFLFAETLDLPPRPARAHPCDSCAGKPCLAGCPVGAFSEAGYDWQGCKAHVATVGAACRETGCQARHACPVGTAYAPEQAAFHMAAFLRA